MKEIVWWPQPTEKYIFDFNECKPLSNLNIRGFQWVVFMDGSPTWRIDFSRINTEILCASVCYRQTLKNSNIQMPFNDNFYNWSQPSRIWLLLLSNIINFIIFGHLVVGGQRNNSKIAICLLFTYRISHCHLWKYWKYWNHHCMKLKFQEWTSEKKNNNETNNNNN